MGRGRKKGKKLSWTVGICFGTFSYGCLEKTQVAGLHFLRWVGLNLTKGIGKTKFIYTNTLKEECLETDLLFTDGLVQHHTGCRRAAALAGWPKVGLLNRKRDVLC